MQQESPTLPHVWLLLSNVVTAILAVVTTIKTLQFKQKREPAEVRKIDAETRGIHTSADVSFGGLTLETFREIQAVIAKAEQRREDWLLKEEQLHGKINHWRCKAEELDGELIDSRDANTQLRIRYGLKDYHLKRAMRILAEHNISFSEGDEHPKDITPPEDTATNLRQN